MARTVTVEDLENLAIGAAILGTGGGGNAQLGKLIAQARLREFGPVQLVHPSELADDDVIIPVAGIGAPTVGVEQISNGEEGLKALRSLEDYLGKRAAATMPMECGGINSAIPFEVAAQAGIPVVDADGMGRAFPELQMVTFHVFGVSAAPATIVDHYGTVCVFDDVPDAARLEWLARGLTIRMSGHAYMAHHAMSGAQVKTAAIAGTVSVALDIGAAVREARERGGSPFEGIYEVCRRSLYGRPYPLFKGKIVDLSRKVQKGFARGFVELDGLEEDQGHVLKVDIQNENLIARKDGETVATVPDLITILDNETGEAITTERLHFGQRVRVVVIPAPEIMRGPKAIETWGPRYFGYDEDFTAIERRVPEYYAWHGLPEGKEAYLKK